MIKPKNNLDLKLVMQWENRGEQKKTGEKQQGDS